MTGGHIHIFEKGSIRIQPLVVDEDTFGKVIKGEIKC